MGMLRLAALLLIATTAAPRATVALQAPAERVPPGVEQLRHACGEWSATTEFFDESGALAASFEGTYSFRWVVEDRVLSGASDIPALGRRSAILFYVNLDREQIEMSAVGADGELWVMTGPIDGEVRTTPAKTNADGTTLTLRFTRFGVEPDRFESRMEVSADGGETWRPGNHQVFVRKRE